MKQAALTAAALEVIRSTQHSAEPPGRPSSEVMMLDASEVMMLDTRRCFLKNLAGISSSFLLFQSSPSMPTRRRRFPVDPPTGAEKQDIENPVDTRNLKRAQLQAQEKQFRETMAHLYTKVTDLKTQVDALHSAEVFSVDVFKQTQEIEKLAKRLKNYAKP